MKQGSVSHPMQHAAPQLFTGASAPKKKVFVGPVQRRRIRQTIFPAKPPRPAVRLVGL